MLEFLMNQWTFVSCDLRVSSHSGQRAEQKQEVGVVVSFQEEVGLSRGAGSDRGGEDGDTSARPSCIQTQKVLPLRKKPTPGTVSDTSIHMYLHTRCKLACTYNGSVNMCIFIMYTQRYLNHSYICLFTRSHTFDDAPKLLIQVLNTEPLTLLIRVLSIFMLTIKVFLEAFNF